MRVFCLGIGFCLKAIVQRSFRAAQVKLYHLEQKYIILFWTCASNTSVVGGHLLGLELQDTVLPVTFRYFHINPW